MATPTMQAEFHADRLDHLLDETSGAMENGENSGGEQRTQAGKTTLTGIGHKGP
jgi:hypothetical protein